MNTNALNKLVYRLSTIKHHLNSNEKDPLLIECYKEYRDVLNKNYGAFMGNVLSEVHHEFGQTNEAKSVDDYIVEGVEVKPDNTDLKLKIFIKALPLRIVVKSSKKPKDEEVLWQVF